MSSNNSPPQGSPKQEACNGSFFFGTSDGRKPYLAVVEQPQSRFRFRYKSEMTGTHGSLMGESQDKSRKTYPTVKLENFTGQQVVMRCSLATNEPIPLPHVHSLEGDSQGEGADFQEVSVNSMNDHIASFQGITIIHTGKKHVKEVFERRLKAMYLQEAVLTNPEVNILSSQVQLQIRELVDNKANSIDLHAVRLKFEALSLTEIPGVYQYVCPAVYSNPVCNLKATQTGDLRIVRIDKHVSCVTGNEEVFIFVEKVNKRNIKVRFFELDEETGQEVWHSFAEFSELDVHHQYAIAFKTPPYKDLDIESDVDVYLQLYRPQDQAVSDPKPFKYKPRDQPRKRVRLGVGAGESIDTHLTSSPYRGPSQGSVIVSPNTPALNKNGSSGSSDTASNSAYLAQLRAVYNVPADQLQTFPVTTPRSVQGGRNRGGSFQPQDMHQMYYQPQPAPMVYHYLQPVAPLPARPQTNTPKPVYRRENPMRPPTHVNPAHWKSDSDVLSSEMGNYLSQLEGQGGNVGHDSITGVKSGLGGNILECIPPQIMSKTSPEHNQHRHIQHSSPEHTTVDMDRFLQTLQEMDAGASPPNLSDTTNLTSDCADDEDCPSAVSRGIENMNLNEKKEEYDLKDLGVAKTLGLSLGISLRAYAVTGDILPLMVKMGSLVALQDEEGDHGLHSALAHYQMEAFQLLLSSVAWRMKPNEVVNIRNYKWQTSLHIAVLTNNSEAVKSLLLAGADPDIPDKNGNTPLHIAASEASLLNSLRQLLAKENRVTNKKNSLERKNYTDGFSALHIATFGCWSEGVQLLLKSGADSNQRDYRLGRTALQIAVQKNSLEIVNLILKDKKVNPNQQAYDGTTALHSAVLAKNKEICIELLKNGADPYISSYIPVGESYYEESSDSEDEEFHASPQTPLELAEDIPEIFEILSKPWAKVEEPAGESDVCENVVASTGDTMPPDYKLDPVSGTCDSGIDIDSSNSNATDSSNRGSREKLDFASIESLALIFHPQSQAFAQLLNDPDFHLFRPVLRSKENPSKYLLSNLPVSLRAFRNKMSNLQMKDALEIVEKCLNK